MKTNENGLDRIIRLIIGVVLFYVGFFTISGIIGIIVGLIGIIVFITGVTGYCLLYKVVNISTKKESKTNTA